MPTHFSRISLMSLLHRSHASLIYPSLRACFIQKLKHAVITPILKKPGLDPEDPSSQRPIAGLSYISKLIEREVYIQSTPHLKALNLLPLRQSAYRVNHSTETTLLCLYNDLLLTADVGKASAFLDLTAAFDTIDHGNLLNCLSHCCGIGSEALNRFSSYLSGRSQCIRVDDCLSASVDVHYGLPQVSVGGSPLFSIISSTLSSYTQADDIIIDQYSDDTSASKTFELLLDNSDQTTTIASLGSWTDRYATWLWITMSSSPYRKLHFSMLSRRTVIGKSHCYL